MKTIKYLNRIATVVVATVISSSVIFAQNSGVFKAFADFKAGKMEYGIDCAKEKHKIKLNDFLDKDFITIVHDGKPYDLKKAEIWGYQLCDEKVVRFQWKEHYPLEDKSVLWIYTKQSVKSVSRGGTKAITIYYFSKGGDGEVKELTLLNLKAAFPENHALHDAIDTQFKTVASLADYDQYHKHYKINHFLESQGLK